VLTRVDRVVIAVRDIERGRQQAISVLGLTPSWVGGYPGNHCESVLFPLANVSIELLSPARDQESEMIELVETHLKEKGDGLFALVLESDDIERDTTGLVEQGLSPTPASPGLCRDEPSGAYRRFRESWLPTAETGGIRIGLVEYSSLPEELPPCLPTQGKNSTVLAGDHVVVMTAKPERAIDLYREKLGIHLALDKTFEKRGVRLLFFRLGDFTIEIGCRHDPNSSPADDPTDDLLWGLAYSVSDADSAGERIAKAGLEVSPVRTGHKPGTRVCTVKGAPLGVPTLIIDQEPKSRSPITPERS
jgi:catechol 2,3-dioxygenase-like lactoylglutathione lyase family enzyme